MRKEPGHMLLGQGCMLTDQTQIDSLLERGVFVKLANGDTANTPHVHSLISSDGWVFPETKPRGNVMIRLDRQKLFGYVAD